MLRYARYILLAVVLVFCVTLALANRAPVTLALWPDTISAFVGFGYAATLPLFAVVGIAAGAGLVFGLVWEWLRERSMRVDGARARRELDRVRAGIAPALPPSRPADRPRDQVLAILDGKDD